MRAFLCLQHISGEWVATEPIPACALGPVLRLLVEIVQAMKPDASIEKVCLLLMLKTARWSELEGLRKRGPGWVVEG